MTSPGDEFPGDPEALHAAAARGGLPDVRRRIEEGGNPNAFDEDRAWTPLHHAARGGHLEVMRALLEAGADVDAHDAGRIGNTPLREVAANCSYEVAKLLIDAGADPTLPGWMGISALDAASRRTSPEGSRVHALLRGVAASGRRGRDPR